MGKRAEQAISTKRKLYYNVPNGENLTKYLIYFSPRSFFILSDISG